METTIDAVGRIVVPKPLRDALGSGAGHDGGHLALRRRAPARAGRAHRAADRRRAVCSWPPARRTIDDDDGLRPDRRRPAVTPLALDTSVAIPLLVRTHRAPRGDRRAGGTAARSRSAATPSPRPTPCSPGSPATSRLAPADAARLIRERFAAPLMLRRRTCARLADVLGHARNRRRRRLRRPCCARGARARCRTRHSRHPCSGNLRGARRARRRGGVGR